MAKNELVETKGTAVDASLLDIMGDADGLGLDTIKEEDKILAQLRVAQNTSPQLKAKNAKYIPGLKMGDLFNSATNAVYGSSVKIAVLGVYKALIVWSSLEDVSNVPPEETVFEAVNPKRYAEIYNACTVTDDNKRIYKGTKRVNTTLRVAAVVFNEDGSFEPIMIDCPKTRYKNAKQLNTLLSNIRYTGKDGRMRLAPTCLSLIRLEVVEAGNEMNEWYEYKFSRVLEDDLLSGGFFKVEIASALLDEARNLRDNLLKGKVVLEAAPEVEGTEEDVAEAVFDAGTTEDVFAD